ncbi:MAG TPA: alpha/beta hydrolase [Thermoplasmata archaeon]|nr:alpha/beta hydrolase [Thermoplasmata archaeon]
MARLRRVHAPGRREFEYIAQGTGPATLLVHPGGPGLTYHYLRGLLRLASANLRVVLFNPRGVGHSWAPRRAAEYTVANLAEDVEAIRRALRIRELHLLGFSAGGFVALEYAHRYERHLTSLLLCATAGSAEEVRQANRRMVAAASPGQRARLRELTRARAFGSPEYVALVEAIQRPFQARFLRSWPQDWKATRAAPAVYRAMVCRSGDEFEVDGTLARWDGRRYYSRIEVPTAVVVGRYDYFFEAAVEANERIEPAHLRVLPRSSHLAILEQPREFVGTVREFLGDVTGG